MKSTSDVSPARILVADDEPLYLRTTGELLRKAGFECECVADAPSALAALDERHFDLLLSDLNMPGNLKLEFFSHQRSARPQIPLIVITGVPSLPTAIESLRLGIVDYLIKPVRYDDLLFSIRRALSQRTQNIHSTPSSGNSDAVAVQEAMFSDIIGESPPMQELFCSLRRISDVDTNVLITGESGTGKEIVARTIHQHSKRSGHTFRIIDCTAIPETLFESVLFGHAKGAFTGATRDQKGLLSACHLGTAFFDEIGELPLMLQAKLLRAVQEQTFTPVGRTTAEKLNTRFVCATNRDLSMEVTAGRFRRDLFYRLAVVHLELPPLRDRGDDVILLAQHFLRQLQSEGMRCTEFTEGVLACFRQYSWPGNVRELRNVIERTLAFARTSQIDVCDLPPAVRVNSSDRKVPAAMTETSSLQSALSDAEHQYLVSLMTSYCGNVSRAASQAGVSRQGMHKMLARHGINASDFRG